MEGALEPAADGAVIENVTVSGATQGLDIYESNDPTWRNNTVTGYTDMGVEIELTGNTTVRFSNFEYTNETALKVVDADDTLDAKQTWRGSADGPCDSAFDEMVGDASISRNGGLKEAETL